MASKIIQCKECKRIFPSNGDSLCPVCLEKMDNDYTVVREYLYNNPMANVIQIIEETNVTEKTLLYFLKDGRIAVESGHEDLLCEKCKTPITFGRFCKKCQAELEKDILRVCDIKKSKTASESRAGKMHLGHYDV